jgi:PAS domain S-box-containing protein
MLSNIVLPWAEISATIGTLITVLLGIGNVKLRQILSQTKSNGGSTLKDAMVRIESNLQDLTLLVEAGHHLSPKPIFRTDSNGNFTWVNTSFTRLVGMGMEELKGLGWMTSIDESDVHRVSIEWEASVKDRRKFESVLFLKNSYNDTKKKVKIRAFPILKRDNMLGFLGTIFLLEEMVEAE